MKKVLKLGHVKLDTALSDEYYKGDIGDLNELYNQGLVVFWITEQSHRGDSFSDNIGLFIASDGARVFSLLEEGPNLQIVEGECLEVCVMCGGEPTDDARKILCTLDEWTRIEAAVAEYNETEF